MSSIVVQAFISLDGVVQGPGGPDEDPSGGFDLGGWSLGFDEQNDTDGEGGAIVGEWESRTEAFLLSLRTAILRSRLALQNTNLLSLETNIRTPD